MNEDRVLKTGVGQYLLRTWDGVNASGIEPVGDKVLVLVDPAIDQTKGGIIITGDSVERQTLAGTSGILIALGAGAWAWDSDRMHRFEGEKPTIGVRVVFQKYAGQEYTGLDGELYRVMQDKVIGGTQGSAIATVDIGSFAGGGLLYAGADQSQAA